MNMKHEDVFVSELFSDKHVLELFLIFNNIQAVVNHIIKSSEQLTEKDRTRVYHRIYRKVKRLVELKLLEEVKAEKKTVAFKLTKKALDLLAAKQNSNSRKNADTCSKMRINEFRFKAIQTCKRRKMLSEKDKEFINDLFDEYLDDCNMKRIVLILKDEFSNTTAQLEDILILNYKTRFTDERRLKTNIKIYHSVFATATRKYSRAVHLVLTTDPNRFKNLYEANRHFAIAFNRFMSYLTKIFKKRPPYIAAFEFTKSGLLHCHLIIFNVNYLMHKQKITEVWQRCGQGTYNYVYALKNDNGKWVYARKKPDNLRQGETAEDYLKKYLIKAQYNVEAASLYWVINKRFFTYSRKLLENFQKRPAPAGIYKFLMSIYDFDVSYVYVHFSDYVIFEEPPPCKPTILENIEDNFILEFSN